MYTAGYNCNLSLMHYLLPDKLFFLLKTQEANQSSLMSLEMEDYQKSLEALQTKLSTKEKALHDSQDEVTRVDKRADDFKTQIGERNERDSDSVGCVQSTPYDPEA